MIAQERNLDGRAGGLEHDGRAAADHVRIHIADALPSGIETEGDEDEDGTPHKPSHG